jgi:phenylpropionate dioxygenase-like ring-hydroxylating dioxygenase large terminal subunit
MRAGLPAPGPEESSMSGVAAARQPLAWPSNSLSEVPFRLYTDPAQYRLELERIFKGPTWSFLCLAAEIPRPGDWVATTIGETPIVVARDQAGGLRAFVNRCAHRGNLLCIERRGNAERLTCIYHGWSYALDGRLLSVAFERGVRGRGGMPPEFRKDEVALPRLRVAEYAGLVFGTLSAAAPEFEDYIGPEIGAAIRRVLNRPLRLLGRSTQVLPNNWKLYAENTKDAYHASILHTFLTTFRINRLSQPARVFIEESGGHHFSQVKLDYAAEDADYRREQLRADSGFRLQDPSVIEAVDEYGDGVSVQILGLFPNMVLQQIRNTIAVRVIRPKGVDRTELDWLHLGFESDDAAMTERRLRHGNLVGAAGYIALEDGCVGGFVQRALAGHDDGSGIVMLGGHEAEAEPPRASEAAVRGFWKKYRALIGN